MSRSNLLQPGPSVVLRLGCVALAVLLAGSEAHAQLSYQHGQNVSPAFEGWEANDDGTFSLIFGYINRNWAEELDVPVGPENFLSPGPEDQGQPTRFLPRRNRYAFKVDTRADKGQIKRALESIYGIRVLSVATQNRPGKVRRYKYGHVKSSPTKRAIVRIHPDDRIELF